MITMELLTPIKFHANDIYCYGNMALREYFNINID